MGSGPLLLRVAQAIALANGSGVMNAMDKRSSIAALAGDRPQKFLSRSNGKLLVRTADEAG
ncbi:MULTISPECIES: hypothetical protein [Bradyrhizobium]|uniref:hypothetical protein n=1 Tax=Bradyrhizobium pachyrhizi TaxID=280333 RepID=UPI002AA580C7